MVVVFRRPLGPRPMKSNWKNFEKVFVEDVDKAWFNLELKLRMIEIFKDDESKIGNSLLWATIKYILTTKWGINK